MQKSQNEIWFPAKKYGFGWGLPVKWQGWVVILAYILLIIGSLALSHTFWYILLFTALLILICWIKGEKPGWRWGNKKQT